MKTQTVDYSGAIIEIITESIKTKQHLLEAGVVELNQMANIMKEALASGKKILFFGNGGSAADSQHFAAELVSKFNFDRKALPAIALTTDTSILTSISNDYDYERVFARQIEALGQPGDVAFGISTSGNSANVLQGLSLAREKGLKTIGLTGTKGGKLKEFADICFRAPSDSTPRIQEVHITVAHVLCDILERELCGI